MEYQKIINLLDNTLNQSTKFRRKNWIEINDDSSVMYNTNSVSETIIVTALAAGGGNNNIQLVFKNCAPFTYCKSEINNTQVDSSKDINVVMLMYNLTEYIDNYSKTSEGLWKYYRDEPALTNTGTLDNFPGNSVLFKFK